MTDAVSSARLTLPPDLDAPARARAFLRATCAGHDDGAVAEVELLVSEVVTNAVRHGLPPITLAVDCAAPGSMQVRVTDGSTTPPLRRQATTWEESGRGMQLVDLLSEAWGTEVSEDGKTVWFRLAG